MHIYDDLAIGVPGEKVGSLVKAGAIAILDGTSGGLSGSSDQLIDQNDLQMPGFSGARPNARFGNCIQAGLFDNDNYADVSVLLPGRSETADANFIHETSSGVSLFEFFLWRYERD